jgi:hypothetical protein
MVILHLVAVIVSKSGALNLSEDLHRDLINLNVIIGAGSLEGFSKRAITSVVFRKYLCHTELNNSRRY